MASSTTYYINRDFLFKAVKKNAYESPSINSISLSLYIKKMDLSLFYSGLSFLTLVCDNFPYINRLHSSPDKKKLGTVIGVSSYLKKQNYLDFLQSLSCESMLNLDLSQNSTIMFNNIVFKIKSDFFTEYNSMYQKFDKITNLDMRLTTSKLSREELSVFLSIWCQLKQE